MLSIRESEIAREQVHAILAAFESDFPQVASEVSMVPGDPKHPKAKVRKEIDQWRARLMPRFQSPKGFWNRKWCFYEIISGELGRHHFRADERTAVQFLQASTQKVISNGAYKDSVARALVEFTKQNRSFRFEPINAENRYAKAICAYKSIDPKTAAADLAKLIQSTLPIFRAFP